MNCSVVTDTVITITSKASHVGDGCVLEISQDALGGGTQMDMSLKKHIVEITIKIHTKKVEVKSSEKND